MTFKHSKKWYFWAKWISKIVGGVFCVLPALIATFLNFPIMITKNADSTVSLFFVIAIIISCSALLAVVVKSFKDNSTLSISVVLALITLVFVCVYKMEKSTIKGLAWVSGCAACGVLLATLCFKLYDMWNDLYMHCGEVYVK